MIIRVTSDHCRNRKIVKITHLDLDYVCRTVIPPIILVVALALWMLLWHCGERSFHTQPMHILPSCLPSPLQPDQQCWCSQGHHLGVIKLLNSCLSNLSYSILLGSGHRKPQLFAPLPGDPQWALPVEGTWGGWKAGGRLVGSFLLSAWFLCLFVSCFLVLLRVSQLSTFLT